MTNKTKLFIISIIITVIPAISCGGDIIEDGRYHQPALKTDNRQYTIGDALGFSDAIESAIDQSQGR